MPFRRVACLLPLFIIVSGCHHFRPQGSHVAVAKAKSPTSPEHAPTPIGRPTMGSTVALARMDKHRIAFVSDLDAGAIRRFDLDGRYELPSIPLGSSPGQLLVLEDGRLLALSRGEAKLVALGGFSSVGDIGTDRAWMTVPSDPVGLAVSPDGASTYVTSGAAHALVGFRTTDFERTFELPLAREPRALAVSDEGKRLYVSHAVGSQLTTIDLPNHRQVTSIPMRGTDSRALPDDRLEERPVSDKEQARRKAARERRLKEGLPTCQSFALAKSAAVPGRIFVPEVLVDPGEPEEKTAGYGSSNGAESETPVVAVIDSAAASTIPASIARGTSIRNNGHNNGQSCLLPRAATIDDRTRTLLVACQGIDALVAYDASAATPGAAELRRWPVGAGPTGVAVDPEARQAVVWSQFDHTLTLLPLDDVNADRVAPVIRIAAAPSPHTSSIELGRILFHRTNDHRVSSDGRACASCHPDGRDDGLVWSTPDGPRRSIMLAGRLADTAPFSWQGNASTVQKHLASTFTRLGGTGLEGPELEALVTYVRALPAPQRGPQPDTEADDPRVKAGAAIFLSPRAGCAGCHSGPTFTDGALHNVGSGRAFNTPSLIGVGSTGPWFHDGRYPSLAELLRKSDGKMGHTKHLKPEELASLEAFLGTL